MEEKLTKYILERNATYGDLIHIESLDDGKSTNHSNYKVKTTKGVYVARITHPQNILSYSSLSDEFTILKLLESYAIAPKAYTIDLEYFETPLLFEEYIDGNPMSSLKNASQEDFLKCLLFLEKISQTPINENHFPFKYTYTTYETNIHAWQLRLEEIIKVLGKDNSLVVEFEQFFGIGAEALRKHNHLLKNAPRTFIYNDIHLGNIFITPDGDVKFIDWQKVSLGDPSFMVALFARRFSTVWSKGEDEFIQDVLKYYQSDIQASDFEKLFYLRVFERATSDAIWSVWAEVKTKGTTTLNKLEDSQHYQVALKFLDSINK
jgi:aminoglycoside phosphotransferase (APT) family kinase protein